MAQKKKALFHCWQHSETYGIVELEDGTIKEVSPQLIRFLYNPFKDYDWTDVKTVK